MPIWAYIYCGFVLFGTCFALFDRDRIKRTYVVAGDILDGICGVVVFLIAYNMLSLRHPEVVSTLCFIFTFAWSYHAHRHYLNYQKFKEDIHTSEREEDAKVAKQYMAEDLEYQSEYDFAKTEREAKYWYVGVISIVVLALVPYVYAYSRSVGAFGS